MKAASSQVLQRVAVLADELKLASLQPQIAACRNVLQSQHGIEVAVFGRFKAGKSSFLNHLVGRSVLPIGVVPLTAVITRLRYGPAERAEVTYLDGRTHPIPLEKISLYVSESENPDNARRVESLVVELPALQPLAPLEFVDTPGLGSAFTHNTETALKWLPNVGAALVAVSSDAPLSERDLALIQDLRQHTPRIVLLLTKADLLTEPQRAEVLAFLQKELRRKWPDALPIHFYSVRPGESALHDRLLRELLLPLIQHRHEATNEIIRHKLASLVRQALNYLRVAHAAATQAESARAALREELAEERTQFDLLRSELGLRTRDWSARALDWYLARLLPTQRDLQGRITARLEEAFPRWHLRLPPFLDAWRRLVQEFLQRELGEVSSSRQAIFCEPLGKARTHLTRTLRAFHDRLSEHVKTALGVTLTPTEFTLEFREPEAPPVDVAFAFDVAFTTVGWLIPMAVFRGPIERILMRKARYEVAKNLSRLAAGWRDRVSQLMETMAREAERQAAEELATLEQTLAQTTSSAHDLERAITALELSQQSLGTPAP